MTEKFWSVAVSDASFRGSASVMPLRLRPGAPRVVTVPSAFWILQLK